MIIAASMNEKLIKYLASLDVKEIPGDRLEVLTPLKEFIQAQPEASLNFICTHNSRRSQFAQVWALVAAKYFDFEISSFSGGVEVTACNPRTVAAMRRAGLEIQVKDEDANPHYHLQLNEEGASLELFSKLYDDAVNPKTKFAAVMTCSHADENCPFIPGALARIALNYEDPKAFDDSPKEAEAYDTRCRQIATEMFYVFKSLKDGK